MLAIVAVVWLGLLVTVVVTAGVADAGRARRVRMNQAIMKKEKEEWERRVRERVNYKRR